MHHDRHTSRSDGSPHAAASEAEWRGWRAAAAIVVSSVVLSAIVVAFAATHVLGHRQMVIEDKQRELKNVALILSENTSQSLQALDRILIQLGEKLDAVGVTNGDDLRSHLSGLGFHWDMRGALIGVPFISELGLVDDRGMLVNVSTTWPPSPANFSDREHFLSLNDRKNAASALAGPFRSKTTNQWALAYARKIKGARGEFLGMIGGVIELSHFVRFFEAVNLDQGATISLLREDGTLLVSHPPKVDSVGRNAANSERLHKLAESGGRHEERVVNAADAEDHLLAMRTVSDFPVITTVSLSTGAVLSEWSREALFVSILTAVIVLAIAAAASVSVRNLLRMQRRSDRAVNEQKTLLAMALDNMSQGLCMFDQDCRLILCNQRYLEMYSLPPEIVKPGCPLELIVDERRKTNTFEGDTRAYVTEIRQLIRAGKQAQRLVETPDGRVIRLVHQPMPSGSWVATHEDITVQRRAEAERDRNRDFLNLVVDNIPVTTVVKDAHNLKYVFVNRAGERYYSKSRDQMIGKTPFDILPGPSAQLVVDLDRQLLLGARGPIADEHQIRMGDGGIRIARSTRLPILDEKGEPQYLLAVIEDITERKRAEERIAHLAHHDALTNLPNRSLFRSQLEMAMTQLREGEHLALLYLDVDHFKSINDTLGHPIGDDLLRAIADRLRRCTNPADTVARLGGDEFAIIQTAIRHPQDCIPLLNRIYDAIRTPFELNGHHVVADVSVGVAIAPGDGAEPDELLKNADLALYGAKAEGRGTYRFFELEMDARMKERRTLELDLRQAIARGEFQLYYQPILNIAESRVVGCEALIRWNHPERGLISPAEFIPVAEETGLINQIGEWVLRQACTDAVAWPEHLKVAVNLSPAQFRSRSLVQTIFNAFTSAGLDPGRLELEITETVLMQHTESTIQMLRHLRKLGVRIAIDDFGTGFSSLSYLRSFPISKLKIDRSFVKDLPHDADAMAIVRAVIGLANSLGIVSTAEGVETEEQLQALRTAGCTEMQGYLISKPQPAADVVRFFPAKKARAISAA